jgi:hypothetical protein
VAKIFSLDVYALSIKNKLQIWRFENEKVTWHVRPVVGLSNRAWRLARVLGGEGVGSCGEATIDNATSVE